MNPKTMLELLQKYPPARERRNKSSAVAYLLKQKYSFLKEDVDTIAEMVTLAGSLDREWRQITERQVHLRGLDYETKYKVVKKKQKELGYYQNL